MTPRRLDAVEVVRLFLFGAGVFDLAFLYGVSAADIQNLIRDHIRKGER